MKGNIKMKTFLITQLLFLLPFFGFSQSAETIINKHLENTGGISNWKSLNTIKLKGNLILGLNESYPVEIFQARPNLNKTVMIAGGKKVILNGFNGKKAVQFNFKTGKSEVVKDYKPESFDNDLLDYSSKGFSAIYLGTEKVNTIDCFKIQLKKNTNSTLYFFTKNDYQLVKEISDTEIITYSNFKKSGKYIFAFKLNIKNKEDQSDYDLDFTSIETNKVFSNKEFNF